jgi:predicted nuclease of predicted toxin-antitoxin system
VTRLLADENIPLASVALLRNNGYDVLAISEHAPGIADVDILRLAREQDRVLVTFDRDFGELVYRDLAPVPPAIIYLRLPPSTPEEPGRTIAALLADGEVQIAGRFSVVTPDGIRQRALG